MGLQLSQMRRMSFLNKTLLLFFFFLSSCAIISPRSYDETVSRWKSHKDLEKWMAKDFSFDMGRFKKFEGTLPPPRSPEETFKLKSGIYIDAAIFAKAAFDRMSSSYQAKIVVLLIPGGGNHYVCSFKKSGKLFMMDYGIPHPSMVGVHGPFNSLEEYKRFFEKNHPTIKHVQGITYLR